MEVEVNLELLSEGDCENNTWLSEELSGCKFADKRLGKRFKVLCERLWNKVGESIPFACEDWANTKGAYRFFDNERLSEKEILGGHFEATKRRFTNTEGPILVLQDTTEFSYQREEPELIGATRIIRNGKKAYGHLKRHTICGMLMHSSLAVTTEGLPLGIAAIKFWTRKKFKGCDALKKHINPTRVPIEEKESIRWLNNMKESTELFSDPERCIHIGDRESDIYELFCTAQELGTHFLVRTCVDRLAGDGEHTIATEMEEVKIKGVQQVEVTDKKGRKSISTLDIKYKKIKVLPPVGKRKKYPELMLTVIYATERGTPKDRDRINWKLITDLEITSTKDAVEKLKWYALRWKIEVFHKILKSGCKAESSKLRAAERLTKLIAIYCILSWRIFWMTMLNRVCQDAPPKLALTEMEIGILDRLVKDSRGPEKNLSHYIIKIARLGGYLARASDPPPGNLVMWRGLNRLVDIAFGFHLAEIVGN